MCVYIYIYIYVRCPRKSRGAAVGLLAHEYLVAMRPSCKKTIPSLAPFPPRVNPPIKTTASLKKAP